MRNEGFSRRQLRIQRFLDIRYVGQAYELSVPAAGDFVRAFHREHELRYGHASPTRAIEIVNVRSRFIGATPKLSWPHHRLGPPDCRSAITAAREMIFSTKKEQTQIYVREKLHSGNVVRGPAIIAEYSGTTVVPPGWRAQVDAYEYIILSRGGRNARSV